VSPLSRGYVADSDDLFEDPQLVEIGNRMDAFDLAHGVIDFGPDTYGPHKLPAWITLETEWDARRLEMKYEAIRGAGEQTMVALSR
jgi:hypothetical protein